MKIRQYKIVPYLFILPTFLILLIFGIIPALWGIGLSFFNYPLLQEPRFIGFENYRRLMSDYLFQRSFINTLYYMLGTVPPRIIIGLIIALILNQPLKGKTTLRLMYYFPVITPIVTVSMLWVWILDTHFGILNYLLSLIKINPIPWLTSTEWAMPSVIIMSIWKTVGWNMLVFLSGLQGIPDSFYEAAKLDGADKFKIFYYITLPLLRPTILLAIVMSLISSSQVFDQVYVMTGGGPGYSTMTLVQQIYNAAFQNYTMGYASAISVILLLLVTILSLIQFRFFGKEVEY